MSRFDKFPERLREQAELVSSGAAMEIGEALTVAATMNDAALKIEALERKVKELKDILREHHEWHQQPDLEMKLGDEYFDCASCYVDSALEERTTAALSNK